jgi:hypothetical protein
MTNKKKKQIREHAAKTGMSYQASLNALTRTSTALHEAGANGESPPRTFNVLAEHATGCEGEVLDELVKLRLEDGSTRGHFLPDLQLCFDANREGEVTDAVRRLAGRNCLRVIGREIELSPRGLFLAPKYRNRVQVLSDGLIRYVQQGIERERTKFTSVTAVHLQAAHLVANDEEWPLLCALGWGLFVFAGGPTRPQPDAAWTLREDRQQLRTLLGAAGLLQYAQGKWEEQIAMARHAGYLNEEFHPSDGGRESGVVAARSAGREAPGVPSQTTTATSDVEASPSESDAHDRSEPDARARSATTRDDFSKKTLDVLAKRVGVRCSNPSCRKLTTGPRTDANRIVCIGVGAHITAASPGGKRYDASLTPDQRASEENGIWLCQNDAKLVDNDDKRYTVAVLREWKQKAEAAALAEIEGTSRRPEDAAELELTVGGVVVGGTKPPRPSKRYERSGHCDRHDYELSIAVRNLGNERLTGYHVDVEFPVRPLEQPEAIEGYVRERSKPTRAHFRANGEHAPELFPGDASVLLTIPYYVDDEMHWNHRGTPENHAYVQHVRVTLYRSGLKPVVVEVPFERLTNF